MKVSTDELQVFAGVVDGGSIAAAAERLGIPLAEVSRALGSLEEKLATLLLIRTTRRLELTEEGRVFLKHARGIIAAIEGAEEDLLLRRERPGGKLRVDAAFPFMLHVVLPLVGEFRARFPDVQLELSTTEQLSDLIERRTDLAIRVGRLPDSPLHALSLGRSRLRLLAAPAYLAKAGLPKTPAALAGHACLGYLPPSPLNQWPVMLPDGTPCRISPALAASSGETLRQLALDAQGIVCLADFMTQRDRQSAALIEVLPHDLREMSQPLHALYHRNTPQSARIRCFVDFLADKLKAMV